MKTSDLTTTSAHREAGLELRQRAIDFLTSRSFVDLLTGVLHEDRLAATIEVADDVNFGGILHDMMNDPSWREEFWSIDQDGQVSLVENDEFFALESERRFSHSDTLRKPAAESFALRGLLSALQSAEVSRAFTEAHGSGPVTFMTADIARYRPGHYLRRHDDLYDGRIFGLVLFVHETWQPSYGTRLVAEKPDGRCIVVPPAPSTIAVMRLAGNHFHQVEQNLSDDWIRYSLAVHFGVRG